MNRRKRHKSEVKRCFKITAGPLRVVCSFLDLADAKRASWASKDLRFAVETTFTPKFLAAMLVPEIHRFHGLWAAEQGKLFGAFVDTSDECKTAKCPWAQLLGRATEPDYCRFCATVHHCTRFIAKSNDTRAILFVACFVMEYIHQETAAWPALVGVRMWLRNTILDRGRQCDFELRDLACKLVDIP